VKHFLLSITNACNKSCNYCVMKKWINNPEYPDKATIDDFIVFLNQAILPGDTAEVTGGEPTLHSDLLILLDYLKERNVKTILRTNGIKLGEWRKKYPNMIVVLAKHDSSDEYMEKRKSYLLPHDVVLDSISEEQKQKKENIPEFICKEDTFKIHPYDSQFFVTNDGKVRFSPCSEIYAGNIHTREYNYTPLICKDIEKCSFLLGAWNLAARIVAGYSSSWTQRTLNK